MPAGRLLPGLLLAALAGCASHRPIASQPDYYQGGLTAQTLNGVTRLRLAPVTAPELLRLASVTSALPLYGLYTPQPDPLVFKGRGAHPPVVAHLLDVSALMLPPLRQALQADAGLAALLRPDTAAITATGTETDATLQVSIERLALLGKDTGERNCEVLVVMQARVLDGAGRQRWHAGRVSSRGDDRHVVPCDDVLGNPRLMAEAVRQSLLRSEPVLLQRLRGEEQP